MSGTIKKLREHENKFPYALLGIISSIIVGVGGIIFTIFYKPTPQLDIEVISNFNVLDVKESLGKLDVIYRGNSLNDDGQSLSVIKLKIVNNGDENIRVSSYDDKALAGFELTKGIIPEEPTITASNTSYSKDEISIVQAEPNKILLPKIIINSGDYYEIKLIALHKKDDAPDITAFGVIEGVDKVRVIHNPNASDERSILGRIFSDNWMINLGRFFILGFLFLIVFGLGISLIIAISEKFQRIQAKKSAVTYYKCNMNSCPVSEKQLVLGAERLVEYPHTASSFYKLLISNSLTPQMLLDRFKNLTEHFGLLKNESDEFILNDSAVKYFINFYLYLYQEGIVRDTSIATLETDEGSVYYTTPTENLDLKHSSIKSD